MQDLLSYIVTSLVEHEVNITFEEQEREYIFTIHMHPDDMGIVIGKKGSVVKSIRQLIRVVQPDERKYLTIKLEPST